MPFTVISIVCLAVACFIFFYLLRAIKIINSLKKYTRSINSIESSSPEEQLAHLQNLFKRPELKHAWNEFKESLTTETLNNLAEQTNRQIQDMQNGADKMRVAAERFEEAGERVSQANHITADVLNKAQTAGSSLSGATSELASVVADYRNNREAVSKSIAMLELLAANTQSEQTTRSKFIADLQLHGERLQGYNREAQAFMENVSDVLGKGFEDFSEGVLRSLDKTLGKLDVEMAKASTLLAGSVEQIGESINELDDVLSRVRA